MSVRVTHQFDDQPRRQLWDVCPSIYCMLFISTKTMNRKFFWDIQINKHIGVTPISTPKNHQIAKKKTTKNRMI